MRYKIQCNYNAFITVDVEANDEGAALDKERNYAEDADIRQFNIGEKKQSPIFETE